MSRPVLITVEHPAVCLSCDERVEFGEPAYWVKDVGIWHKECPTPRNLRTYVDDAQRRGQ